MARSTGNEERLTRYLLGGLPEGEREQLEAEYFEDDDAFEQMLIAEEELNDAYVREELPAEERARFEQHYLSSPRGGERVKFARSLARAVRDARGAETTPAAEEEPRPSLFAALWPRKAVWRYAFTAAALVLVAGLVWLLVERARTREESQPARAQVTPSVVPPQEVTPPATPELTQQGNEAVTPQPSPQPARTPRPRVENSSPVLAQRPPGASRNAVAGTPHAEVPREREREVAGLPSEGGVSFELTPGAVRDGGATTLKVPGKATFIQLRLNLATDSAHGRYRATIETPDGRAVWRADSFVSRGSKAERGVVGLPRVPVRDLPPGDYVLSLSGRRTDGRVEPLADYSFRIVRE